MRFSSFNSQFNSPVTPVRNQHSNRSDIGEILVEVRRSAAKSNAHLGELATDLSQLALLQNQSLRAMDEMRNDVNRHETDIAGLKAREALTQRDIDHMKRSISMMEAKLGADSNGIGSETPVGGAGAVFGPKAASHHLNAAAVSNTPTTSTSFKVGMPAQYSKNGSIMNSTIIAVHNDPDGDPYYTIRLSDGREMQTVKEHLISTNPSAPVANKGFQTPQPQRATGEHFFSIGVSETKKRSMTFAERTHARRSALFGTRKGTLSSRKDKHSSTAKPRRKFNASAVPPSTPEMRSKPTLFQFSNL